MVSEILLVLGVLGVGILHTLVPDHWLPIAVLARQRGWTRWETARAAAQAGTGHVVTTLLLGMAAWGVGAAAARAYAHLVDVGASLALIGFGLWIAWGAWRELRMSGEPGHSHRHGGHQHIHPHSHVIGIAHSHAGQRDPLYRALPQGMAAVQHEHWHSHGQGPAHRHWHDHDAVSVHALAVDSAAVAPLHFHAHGTGGRTALLLVLGSSPMIEGIPAFFAASRYGVGLIAAMAVMFALGTVATYVVLSVYGASAMRRLHLGAWEKYGEVLSGVLIALVGLMFGAVTAI